MNHGIQLRVLSFLTVLSLMLSALGIPTQQALAANAGTALQFNGSSQYVTFGPSTGMDTGLGVQVFTIETWFKKTGAGATVSTGTGGITALPLVTKGRGEGDNSNLDMNYFFGINLNGRLAADFEECAPAQAGCPAGGTAGLNHPAEGSTVIQNNMWYHAAVTFDGQNWKFYLNGVQDGSTTTLSAVRYPRWDSIQHAGIGTAMTSNGTAAGYFAGIVDEARVWNTVRTEAEIQSDMYNELTSVNGLIGRWGLNEGTGTTASNSVAGRPNGTLTNGPAWVSGFPDNTTPSQPAGLIATPGLGYVDLAWTANGETDLAGYNVYRSVTSPVTLTTPLNGSLLTSPAYHDTSAVGTHYYVVQAVDTSGNKSAASEEVSAAPLTDTQPPAAPSGLNATGGNQLVNLTWTANSETDLAGYNLYRSATAGGAYDKVNASPITGTSHLDTGLTNGTAYYYVLTAVDLSANESGYSTEVSATPAEAATGLGFTYTSNENQYVTFGRASGLGLQAFTIETWFYWTGGGDTVSTGSGGLEGANVAIPLVSKGRGEGDGSNLDMNYFFGLSNGKLAADFEEDEDGPNANGLNHPVIGNTTVSTNTWHHAAVTYDGQVWKLYLDGALDRTLDLGNMLWPRDDSIQHAGIATAMTSTGLTDGFFAGTIDEVRIWNYARSLTEIRSTISSQLTSGTGLVARWGMNEGGGTTIASSVGSFTGTLTNGPTFAAGAPFDLVFDLTPPATPTGLAATAGTAQVSLVWDANGEADLAGYNVYRSTASPVTKGTPINSTVLTSPAFVDTGVTAGTEYFYAVTALDASANESALSNEASATPQAAPPPTAPSNLNAAASGPYLVNLSWTDNSSDETGFEVERSTTGNTGPFSLIVTTAVNAVSFSDVAVQPGSEHCYRLRAINGVGQSDYTAVSCVTTPVEGEYGLDLGPNNGSHVSFGEAPALKLAQFTLEGWFKREGTGATANTGTGGFLGIPLITKGVGEAEGSNVDMNYFLGIRGTDNVICADFEEGLSGAGPLGQNHPVCGTTVIANSTWYHVAATYDGGTWKLYLDGNPEATLAINQPVRSDSIQHAGLGVALSSTGAASGHFDGVLDEVRVWNYARTRAEILSSINAQLSTPETGLVGRWSLNEGSGAVVRGSAGTTVNGTIAGTGSNWVIPGAPYNIVSDMVPPAAPTNLMGSPRPGAAQLEWTVNTEPDLAGYKVYRSTSSPVTKGSPLNSTLLVTPSFVDSSVTAGTQYFYAVAAVDTSNNESDLSNEASVTPLPPLPAEALDLGSSGAYVSFGDPAALDLAQFTIETWFKRTGAGTISTTGSNGIPSAIPLVTHGSPQDDGSTVDANWVLVIDDATDVIGADFEDMATGANHPVRGTTTITNDIWHHAAATYDGTTWRLYLDGDLEATLAVNAAPRSDTIQQVALGTMLTSTGGANGRFQGVLDEARVWNYARSQAQLLSTINVKLPDPQTGLVARWGLDEATGSAVNDSSGNGVGGTINGTGYSWVPGSPFNVTVNLPPEAPQLGAPADDATNVSVPVTLSVMVSDPEDQPLDLTFYGRPLQSAAGPDFTLIAIPDPQFYASTYPAIYDAQMDWVVANKTTSNIPYVISLGDNVNTSTADPNASSGEWANARHAWDILTAGGVPYGLTLGNHDGAPSSTANFNTVFGSRIASQPTYGGRYGTSDYDNTYATFSASGLDFIVIFIEYDSAMTSTSHPVLAWANGVLQANSTRRAIVVTHNLLQGNSFSTQGAAIYNALKANPNLFLMLGGHLDVAGQRTEVYNGNTVYALRSDYQTVDGQQSGYLRVMRFSPADDMIYVTTYSPTQSKFYDKADAALNNFTLPYVMQGTGFSVLGTATDVPSGDTASMTWSDLDPNEQYEWFVIASDGTHQTPSDTWNFTTAGGNQAPVAGNDSYTTDQETALDVDAPGVLGNDTDANSDPLTVIKVSDPASGSFMLNANGSFTYTPNTCFAGDDTFTYKANDGQADSNTATVTITVSRVNHQPVADVGGPYTADLGSPVTLDGTGSSDTDGDCGDSIVSYEWDTDNDGSYDDLTGPTPTITAAQIEAKGVGTHAIRLRVTDEFGSSATASTTLTIADNVPVASFTVNPNPAACGQTVTFNATASSPGNPNRTIVSYSWDFGDTGTGTGVTTTHAYGSFGSYTATLTITDDSVPPKIDSETLPISVNLGNHLPVADAGGPYTADLGSPLTLDGSGSSEPDAGCGDSIVSYEWDIKDGTYTLTGAQPALSAAQIDALGVGSHAVSLRVRDEFGVTSTAATTLAIYDNQPFAVMVTNPTPAACGQSITFDGSASYHGNPNQSIVGYGWDFGDGTGGTGQTTTHSYSGFGSYTAVLTITDDNAPPRTDSATMTIDVNQGNHPPVANAGGPYIAELGSSVSLNGTGSSDPDFGCGDSLVSYEWDTDNNGIYNNAFGTTPTLTAAQVDALGAGTHTIRLRVTDEFGVASTATATLTIQAVNAAPTDISLSAQSVAENELVDTVIGTLSSTDPDAGGTFTYTLVSGVGDNDNASFNISGDSLRTSVVFDFETKSSHSIRVRTTDQGGLFFEKEFTITITNVVEAYTLSVEKAGTGSGTVTSDPSGIDCGVDCSENYDPSTVVTLTATAGQGSTFTGWSGAGCSGTGTCIIAMDAAKSVSADFDLIEYTLAVTTAGSGSVNRYPDQATYHYGDTVQLTAVPASGWAFSSWSGDLTGTANPDSLTIDGNKTVTATFTSTNIAPIAAEDSYTTDEDTPLDVPAPGVLANDTDSSPLTAVQVSDPAHGAVQFNTDGSFTYTPAADYHGADSFTYKASDGSLDSNAAIVTITVAPVNDAPVAEPRTVQLDEDASIAVTLSGNDPDGDPLTFGVLTPPAAGSLSGSPPDLTYTPGLNYNGLDHFTFQVSDGFLSAQADITIHVEPLNDSPVAVADAYATDENSALDVSQPGVLYNDTDVDGDPLTAILVNSVSHGVLTLDAAGSFHYLPETNFTGEDQFSYKANDGRADSSEVTVTIKVNTVNHAPTAGDDDYSSDEDLVLSIAAPGVLDNDVDTDGDALSAILVSGTSHGALNLFADGSFTYAPELNWHGTDSFTYKVSDSLAESNTATATITVNPVNDPPVAAAQAVSVDEDSSLAITLAGSDVDGDPLTFAIATDPAHGVLSGAPPELTYVPDADFSGSDVFMFTVHDGQATSAPAAVSIAVHAINDPPVCLSLSLLTDEDLPASLSPSCTDADNAVLSYQIATPAQHGTASISGSLLSYSPGSNYYGADNFAYKASDGTIASNVAGVSVTVNSVNDTPVAMDDSSTTPQGTPVMIPVLANDSDADGDALSLTAVSTPAHGSTIANADNTVTYTPSAGWSGPDSFTYTISDGHNGTASATVNITVNQSQNDLIFRDSFDTCNASAWSATTNNAALSFTNAAAWDGSCGMAVSITTSSPAYVRDNTPAAEARYRARFYFNPNSISMTKNDAHALFHAYNGVETPMLTVELRLSGKNYHIRAGLLSDRKKWVYTSWATLSNGWQPIEVDWRASTAAGANNGGLTLRVGGVQVATLSAVDNDTQRVESVALGAVEGVDARTRGTYFFDAFESRRP